MFYQLKFWEAVAHILAGLLALGYIFGYVPAQFALGFAAILETLLAVLRFLGIEPKVRAAGFFKR